VGFRRYHAIVLAATVVIVPLALVSVDITSAAEPSRAETWIASSLLYARVRAQKPRLPERFTTSDIDLDRASTMYQQMCALCHGAARGRPAPFAKALSPRPPQFVIRPSQCPTWMDVYIIQHGVRWTGMPSFEGLAQEDTWHLALYVEGQNQPRE
jgi:mono/diheme cytochrome c family protein